jgi:predicted MFS family arabinose efflux permease
VADPQQDRRTRWPIVWLAVAAGIVGAFQVGKVPSVIPALQADLGLDLVEAGLVVAMFNAVGCALAMIAGMFADMAGARRFILGGLCITGLASLGGAFAADGTELLISRFLEGLGGVGIFVAGPIIIMRAIRPADLRQAFGAWGTYMPTGTAMMVALGALFVDPVGWRGIWIANAAILIGFALIFAAGTRAVPDSAPVAPRLGALKADIGTVAGRRGPWLLGLCFASYTANYLCVVAFLPVYFLDRLKFDLLTGALLTAVVGFANAGGNLCAGRLLQRGVPRWMMIGIGATVMAVCTVFIYGADLPNWMPFFLAFIFAFIGGFMPASIIGAAAHYAPAPRYVGATGGLVVQLGNFGQLLGPPALGALVAVHGWNNGWWLTVGLGAFGLFMAVLIGWHERAIGRAGAAT